VVLSGDDVNDWIEQKIAHLEFDRQGAMPQQAFSNLLLALNPGMRAARSPIELRTPSQPLRAQAPSMEMERTYIMIKPDGVQRGLIGEIIKRFEQRGYKLNALKLYQASEELLKQHYKDLVEKPFFPDLLGYMLSGPVTCMVWEGENAVKMGRQMLGETNPQASLPGTIRGDFSIVVGRNICHGSDSPENAEKEIALWFKEDELVSWKDHSNDWVYE
jgi:nucleoside-diphosphate kinase